MVFWEGARGEWRWRSWGEIAAMVPGDEGVPAGGSGGVPLATALVTSPQELATALTALPPVEIERAHVLADALVGAQQPITLLADLGTEQGRCWLFWALTVRAALVLPARADLVAWSLWWARPTHAAFAVADLPVLRQGLLAEESPRALRRRLARLRHLCWWGDSPPPAEEIAAWEVVGVRPLPFP